MNDTALVNSQTKDVTTSQALGTQQIDDKIETAESDPYVDDPLIWGELKSLTSFEFHYLRDQTISLGRNQTCSIKINNLKVSGTHCIISRNDMDKSIILLEDRSSNGTFLNSKKLIKFTPLTIKTGDIISLAYPASSSDCSEKFLFSTKESYIVEYPELDEDYIVGKELGKGTYGSVRYAMKKENQLSLAIKIIDKKRFSTSLSPLLISNIMNEVNILKQLKHPFITQLFDVIDSPGHLFLCMELVNGGDLLTRLMDHGPYPEHKAKKLFYNLIEAVRYIHSNHIVHRDIKPENILIDKDNDTEMKLSDFGLSKVIGNEGLQTFCGTLQYIAPEILIKKFQPNNNYSAAVDIWSCGIVLYILLCGHPPYNANNLEKQILTATIIYKPVWGTFSPHAKDLVSKMLHVDPKIRLTLEGILNHPWRTAPCPGAQDSLDGVDEMNNMINDRMGLNMEDNKRKPVGRISPPNKRQQ